MLSNFGKDLSTVIGAATSGDSNLKLPFFVNSETEAEDIQSLGLSPRSFNSLKRNKIVTIGQVTEVFSNLVSLRNVGSVSVKEIRQKTADFLYDNMTPTEKKLFWKEFLTLNNIKGLSAK